MQVSVTELAVWVHRTGDLYPGLDGRTTAEEGLDTQNKLQAQKPTNYASEISVKGQFVVSGLTLNIQGRIDGGILDGAITELEEYKTSRADAQLAHQHLGSEHWAQLKIYAALLAAAEPDRRRWLLRLVYAHPDTLATFAVEAQPTRSELLAWFAQTLSTYAAWQLEQQAYTTARNTWLEQRPFPFTDYRPHQRAIAACVYRSLVGQKSLLLEAPTGSGKSLAVLYPALKGLVANPELKRYLFLTSRSTGALAATQALEQIDNGERALRWVVLRAKKVVCPVPGMPCRAADCDYARGYFDRIHGAVAQALSIGALDIETLAEVAETHKVCPFELSLDAALWCDVVIADYNYVFDPVARLLRFASGQGLGLLIDEAHQLFPRACDMLSEQLSRDVVQAAIAETPPPAILSGLRSIDRALMKVTQALRSSPHIETRFIDFPQPLQRGLERFMEQLSTLEVNLAEYPQTREVLFAGIRWLRILEHFDEATHRTLAHQSGRNFSVGYVCLDAADYLGKVLGRFAGDVRFSGTLSPLPLYRELQGVAATQVERAGSPFAADQLATWVVPDIPTYYRQRTASLPLLLQLLDNVVSHQQGRYLVALPSFAYLNQLWDACVDTPLASQPHMQRQTSYMSSDEQAQFLTDFGAAHHAVAMVVLGGRFAESVDFADTGICGVICVGVGIPPPGTVQDERLRYFESKTQKVGGAQLPAPQLDAQQIVLQQPAMVKIVQMAGRLIRATSDRGVLCLVDNRFQQAAYSQFFPALWQPQVVRRENVPKALADFWHPD